MKKLLVIGSAGMAGHVITQYLREQGYQIDTMARNSEIATYSLDLESLYCNPNLVNWSNYDYVINATGILNRGDNVNYTNALFVNSFIPHFIAKLSALHTFQLIHMSTDCVFSGKDGSYQENSPHDGMDLYAKSKSLGEIKDGSNLTIRTSIIGPELKDGVGLFHWFMKNTERIQGFTNAYWSGVTTLELAKFIHQYIESEKTIEDIFHLTNGEPISKYDLLKKIDDVFKKGRSEIEANHDYRIDKSLINTRKDVFDLKKSYDKMLVELKKWIMKHPDIYNQYL